MMRSFNRTALVVGGLLFLLGLAAMPAHLQGSPTRPARLPVVPPRLVPPPQANVTQPGPGGWRESNTLKGFKGDPEQLLFSPDGKSLIAIWSSGALKQWDAATGKELATLKPDPSDPMRDKQKLGAHNPHVLSADLKLLARGRADGTIKLWELSTGKLKGTLHGAGEPVVSVAFSPDGKSLAGGSLDNSIRLWDLDKMTQKGVYEECSATELLFSPDGKTLLANRDSFHVFTAAELKASRDRNRKGGQIAKPAGTFEMTVTAGDHYRYTWNHLDDLLLLDADSLKASKPAVKMSHVFWLTMWPTVKGPVLVVSDIKTATPRDPETLKPIDVKVSANAMAHRVNVSGDGSLQAEGSTFRQGGSFMLCLPPDFARFPSRMPGPGANPPSKSTGQVSIYEAVTRKQLARVEKGIGAAFAALSPDGKTLAASIQFKGSGGPNSSEYRIQLWRDRSKRANPK